MTPQIDFSFSLPRGYQDPDGIVHREGMMRLATANDEILPLKDPRVQANPAYLVVILLSRVITKLGDLTHINPKVIEGLYSVDLAYLQDFYRRINEDGHNLMDVECPHCHVNFRLEMSFLGGALATPPSA
ncbi:MAG: phage tail assembly protein [Nitrospira sp.]